MKNALSRLLALVFVCLLSTVLSCDEEEDDEDIGNWFAAVDFEGQRRAGAVSFTIGNTAFVGLGYDGDDYFNDFYSYNADNGFWEDVADFPGVLRESAVAFTIGDRGYVGLGRNRDLATEELADFWEYNSATNEWRQLNDFPSARYGAVAFAISNRGYVGTGFDGDYYLSDFFEYIVEEDRWSEIRGYPGGKREDALAIAFNGKGYVCTGRNNGSYKADMWVYTPETRQWTDLSLDSDDDDDQYDLFTAAVQRHNAVGFAYQDRIFISTGIGGSSTSTTTYQYNPETGQWDDRTPFEGSVRSRAVAFVVSERIFLLTGQNGSSYWDNMYEFRPDDEYDDED
jgi:N-acetylneuraminic acid mutarotase